MKLKNEKNNYDSQTQFVEKLRIEQNCHYGNERRQGDTANLPLKHVQHDAE